MERRGRLGNSRKLESGKNETLDSSFSNGQIHVQSPTLILRSTFKARYSFQMFQLCN